MHAYIVVDLGFGDAGKGLLTDFLVRHLEADVVVRYNGGAQAGHNVVTPDGRHHTFSQFGAGAFLPHVKTYLSRHMVIHPSALLVEGDLLERKGVWDPFSRLRISDQALVITPFHQATNRIRELARGTSRHGSCGVGVGEAVEDSLSHPETSVFAGDLHHPIRLRQKLRSLREQKYEEISALCKDASSVSQLAQEFGIFEDESVLDTWISSITRIRELGLVVSDSVLENWLETDHAIFEGAQGVLLDADAGFHPFTTWSRCTAANATDLLQQLAPNSSVTQIGVMRSYAVRHGPGPLPTETDSLASTVAEHNQHNDWQGTVRYGWFDAVLAGYALSVAGEMDMIAVTHLDMLSHLEAWKYCQKYEQIQGLRDLSLEVDGPDDRLTNLRVPHAFSVDERARLSEELSAVRPVIESCQANDDIVIHKIEALLGQRVGLMSRGPRATDVQILDALL